MSSQSLTHALSDSRTSSTRSSTSSSVTASVTTESTTVTVIDTQSGSSVGPAAVPLAGAGVSHSAEKRSSDCGIFPGEVEVVVKEWIAAWNSHDLERILRHYSDDVEFEASTVVTRWDRADGMLRGKAELRKHFHKGLELDPQLAFELESIFIAPQGYAVLYRRNNGNRVIDCVKLNSAGLANKVTAYYLKNQK